MSAARFMWVPASASRAMVSPPDVEPVSAASTLVATASDTSGPPSIASTRVAHNIKGWHRRHHNAEPNQARHAEGREHRRVRSGVHRFADRRQSAVVDREHCHNRTDQSRHHGPDPRPIAASNVSPQRISFRKDVSSRGSKNMDMARLTDTTVTSGDAAGRNASGIALDLTRMISAGSNSRAVVARSRRLSSTASRSTEGIAFVHTYALKCVSSR